MRRALGTSSRKTSLDQGKPRKRVKLSHIDGMTATSTNGIAVSESGEIAVACGYYVRVHGRGGKQRLLNTRKKKEVGIGHERTKRISSIVYSNDSTLLAIGEKGYNPVIKVLDSSTGSILSELKVHKYGVQQLIFSRDNLYLFSLGESGDDQIICWAWKKLEGRDSNSRILFQEQLSQPANSVCLTKDESYLLAAGLRSIKYWKVGPLLHPQRAIENGNQGEKENIEPHQQKTISSALSEMESEQQKDDKNAMEIGSETAYENTHASPQISMNPRIESDGPSLSGEIAFIAEQQEGTHELVLNEKDSEALETETEARPAGLLEPGHVLLIKKSSEDFVSVASGTGERGEGCCVVTSSGQLLSINGSMALDKWVDLRTDKAYSVDVQGDFILCSCASGAARIFHAVSLRHILTLPKPPHPADRRVEGGKDEPPPDVVAGLLLQNSIYCLCLYDDGRILEWKICGYEDSKKVGLTRTLSSHKNNVLSVIPLGDGVASCDFTSVRIYKSILDEESNGELGISLPQLVHEYIVPDGSLRTIASGRNTGLLALGDVNGGVKVLSIVDLNEIARGKHHSAEILSMDVAVIDSYECVATGGRDRRVVVSVIDEESHTLRSVLVVSSHTSSVAVVRLVGRSSIQKSGSSNAIASGGRLFSCGADNSLAVRMFNFDSQGSIQVGRTATMVVSGGSLPQTMDVDPRGKYLLFRSADRAVRVIDVEKWEKVRKYTVEEVRPTFISFDSSGLFVLLAGNDRRLFLLDFFSGAVVAAASGPVEPIRGATTTPCGSFLAIAGGKGCVYFWKLSKSLKMTINRRMTKLREAISCSTSIDSIEGENMDNVDSVSIAGVEVWGETPRGMWAERETPRALFDRFSENSSVFSDFTDVSEMEEDGSLSDRLGDGSDDSRTMPMEILTPDDMSLYEGEVEAVKIKLHEIGIDVGRNKGTEEKDGSSSEPNSLSDSKEMSLGHEEGPNETTTSSPSQDGTPSSAASEEAIPASEEAIVAKIVEKATDSSLSTAKTPTPEDPKPTSVYATVEKDVENMVCNFRETNDAEIEDSLLRIRDLIDGVIFPESDSTSRGLLPVYAQQIFTNLTEKVFTDVVEKLKREYTIWEEKK